MSISLAGGGAMATPVNLTTAGVESGVVETGWRTLRVDPTAVANGQLVGTEVRLRVIGWGNAMMRVDRVQVAIDSDGDGISDNREKSACLQATGHIYVERDPTKADTDGN